MPAKSRTRRLRKKLFLDEFTVYAFELRLNLATSSPEEEIIFIDALIDKLTAMHLKYVGHFLDERLRGFIIAKARYASPTADQRQDIIDWCNKRHDIAEANIGELVNAYHPASLQPPHW